MNPNSRIIWNQLKKFKLQDRSDKYLIRKFYQKITILQYYGPPCALFWGNKNFLFPNITGNPTLVPMNPITIYPWWFSAEKKEFISDCINVYLLNLSFTVYQVIIRVKLAILTILLYSILMYNFLWFNQKILGEGPPS